MYLKNEATDSLHYLTTKSLLVFVSYSVSNIKENNISAFQLFLIYFISALLIKVMFVKLINIKHGDGYFY